MDRDKQFTNKIFRDGVSQGDRFLQELESDYISVEERDKKDLISFSQKFAQYLNFYDDSNQVAGDWSSFFASDVEEMVAYIDQPESFADERSKFNQLSQPHLVLFFTFLELLRYPQQQFKALNQRHLNFYYQNVLKLTEKPEIADQVHIILELASGLESHLLEKGTLINAGQDSQGTELNYVIDEDIVINQAQVASVENLFIWKKYTSLEDIHQPNKSNRSFAKMLQWAVGSPNQGDPLPSFAGTDVDMEFLNNLYQEIKGQSINSIDRARQDYILKQLFFATINDFKYCLEIHYRQLNHNNLDIVVPTKIEWAKVYELVEKAYRKKLNWQRRQILSQEHLNPEHENNNDAFKNMMRLALGNPNPGDLLPELPSGFDNLDDFLATMVSPSALENLEIVESQEHQVMEFDGTNDYIEVAAHTNPTTAITVSAWAKSNTDNWNDNGCLVSKRAPYILHSNKDSKSISFYVYVGGEGKQVDYGSISNIKQWHHYAGTFDGKTLKLFVDGVEVASKDVFTATTAIDSDTGSLCIGKDDETDRYFNGQISEVRIWNKARTAEEISADMNQRLTGQELGLVGYWALNEIDADTQQILDLSSNQNNGTVNGSAIINDSDLPISLLAENESENDVDDDIARYITEQLYMSVADFQKITNTKAKADSTDTEWEEVYRLLEKAQTRKRDFTYPPLGTTKIENIYADSLVDVAEGEVTEAKRFSTFANITKITESQDHYIGFAIASPILVLNEGSRSITLTLSCQENTLNRDIFPDDPNEQVSLFDIYFSSETEWIEVAYPVMRVGDFVLEPEINSYAGDKVQLVSRNAVLLCNLKEAGELFVENDLARFLVFGNGNIYQITERNSERQVRLNLVGQLPSFSDSDTVKKYSVSGIYPHSLQFQFNLDNKSAPVTPSKLEPSAKEIEVDSPVIKILLRPEDRGGMASYYEQLQSIKLSKATIQVDVRDIQDIQLRNDNSVLDAKSPFLPFGNYPKVGSSFYFSNAEIIQKKLASLTLNLEWMGLPEDFATYYQAYYSSGVINNAIANDSFQASLQLLNNRKWVEIEHDKAIFNFEGNTLNANTSLGYHNFNLQDYTVSSNSLEYIDEDDPFEQNGYFKLELENQGFIQELYPIVLSKIALSTDENLKSLTVYPPYTPEIKSISLNYTASVEIDLSNSSSKPNPNQIFQIHPFGYGEIHTFKPDNSIDDPDNRDDRYYLLPHYEEQGALYIGIRDLQPPQNISILFQMIAGSGQLDLAQPQVNWSYLSGEYWRDFAETEILADSTNSLIDTGIIRFQIPETISQKHHLLPSGLCWLRATVTENPTAVPDILDIKTQAVKATYINQGNAAEHLNKPLPAESIQGLVARDTAIKTVLQPYTSFGGKPKEDKRAFTIRVSERLRHKQRALTPWDYEHLVLEHFPAIYKAKCITSAIADNDPSEARVTVVVVPDISHTAPFFPLEPKVPLSLLKEIENYLKKYTSPFVNLIVKNPRYEQIKYRVGIRLRPGYEQGYYVKQLNEDIKRFLSPWAYEGEADISFGSAIHNSSVVHLIEKKPYVDYVTNLKLIEQVAVKSSFSGESDLGFRVNESEFAQVQHPDSILVSAPEHIIDLITTEQYEEEDFEGIDYMILDVDFIVT